MAALALSWLQMPGWAMSFGPAIAPGEVAAGRVFLRLDRVARNLENAGPTILTTPVPLSSERTRRNPRS
jgi:hypothetical protein